MSDFCPGCGKDEILCDCLYPTASLQIVLGIDPGLRCTGIATYDGRTVAHGSIRVADHDLSVRVSAIVGNVLEWLGIVRPDVIVIELPQVYQGRLQKGDPNDLIDLAVLVGALLHAIPHSVALLPRPREWKGQVPKDIHHRRIRERIPDFGPSGKDTMDAVGLALWGYEHARAIGSYNANTET